MCIRNGEWVIISRNKERLKIFTSLKFRIFILVIVVGLVPCLIMEGGILSKYRERAVSLRTMDVRTQCEMIANRISNSGYLEDTSSSEVVSAQISQLASFYDGRILVIDSYFRVVADTYSMSVGKIMASEEILQCFKSGGNSSVNNESQYIELTVPIKRQSETDDSVNTIGVILVAVSTSSIEDSMEILTHQTFIIKMVVFTILIVIAFLSAFYLVRPFSKITQQLGKWYDGYGIEEINVPAYQETRQISAAINETISRMKVLDDSRQEFVSNVSHELKTPITSMKVLADSLLQQENVPVELYEEFMQDIAAEIDRESKIIDDLLSLVKMDKTTPDLNIVPVNINELLELILKRLRPIAAQRNIEIVLVCVRQVVADADEVKLTLALSNFVENAIKYNKDNGWVSVTLDADHKNFVVTVEDSGIGIPEEDYEHIFERFYRVDKSHSREIGGTGLGLAIARSAILMHRGSVEVASEVGKGTKFTIRVPLIYIMG